MQSQTYKKKNLSFTNPLIRSNLLLLFTCSLAVLPVCVCSIFPPQRLQIRSTPQRITVTENHTHLFYTVNTSTHSILHIYTPCLLICSVLVCLFCFVLLFYHPPVLIASVCSCFADRLLQSVPVCCTAVLLRGLRL